MTHRGPIALGGPRPPSKPGATAAGYQVKGNLARKPEPLPEPEAKLAERQVGAASQTASAGAARSAVIVARALLEVLSGWRPPSQLARWTSYALQQDLERRVPRRPAGTRLHLLRVRVSEPADGVAEVCALAQDTTRRRVRVIALRMEQRTDGWVVTRLQAG